MKIATLAAFAVGISAFAFSPIRNAHDLKVTGIDLNTLERAFDLDSTVDEEKKPGPCQQMKITEAQKASLKTAFIAHKKAQIQIEAELKTAGLDYFVALGEIPGAKGSAEKASTALSGSVGKMVNGHLAFANQIFFDILTPEQRKPALQCAKLIMEHHKKEKIKKLCEKHPQD